MTGSARILILGGYGVFGGRLARLLADEARLTLVIAGRSPAKARAFCAGLGGAAATEAAVFERDRPVEAQLRPLRPGLIIDAMGPFQGYGTDPYGIVRAALALGVDYMDFADGSDFVAGIARFDAEARERGVFVLSGVSSFPVLTAAVVRRLAGGLARVETVTGGIAPSPYAGVGLNVIRAIAGYAGQPVRLTRGGRAATGQALTEAKRYTIAPPGHLPLDNTRFSLVDVPDLQVLPPEWPGLREIWMGAGPVPEVLHRALGALAWGVRLRLLPSLAPCARLFHLAINRLRWGEHRGGMFIEVTGADAAGRPATRSWHLIAEGDDGPLIPAMALEALVRRCISGQRPAPGARAAIRELDLADYDRLFARRTIVTGIREAADRGAPLYQRLLGDAWGRLPEPLRRMHEPGGGLAAEGRATVERGRGPLVRLVALAFSFPAAGRDLPVRVTFTPTAAGEHWRRDLGDGRFASLQAEGRGRSAHLLAERFGPFEFGLALVLDGNRLRLIPRRWTAFGLPMPRWLMPGGDSFETVKDGRFRFHVEIRLPLAGLVVRYRGWLAPCADLRAESPGAAAE
jgi:hypothetical protein